MSAQKTATVEIIKARCLIQQCLNAKLKLDEHVEDNFVEVIELIFWIG
jgi:hypothetical protein